MRFYTSIDVKFGVNKLLTVSFWLVLLFKRDCRQRAIIRKKLSEGIAKEQELYFAPDVKNLKKKTTAFSWVEVNKQQEGLKPTTWNEQTCQIF